MSLLARPTSPTRDRDACPSDCAGGPERGSGSVCPPALAHVAASASLRGMTPKRSRWRTKSATGSALVKTSATFSGDPTFCNGEVPPPQSAEVPTAAQLRFTDSEPETMSEVEQCFEAVLAASSTTTEFPPRSGRVNEQTMSAAASVETVEGSVVDRTVPFEPFWAVVQGLSREVELNGKLVQVVDRRVDGSRYVARRPNGRELAARKANLHVLLSSYGRFAAEDEVDVGGANGVLLSYDVSAELWACKIEEEDEGITFVWLPDTILKRIHFEVSDIMQTPDLSPRCMIEGLCLRPHKLERVFARASNVPLSSWSRAVAARAAWRMPRIPSRQLIPW